MRGATSAAWKLQTSPWLSAGATGRRRRRRRPSSGAPSCTPLPARSSPSWSPSTPRRGSGSFGRPPSCSSSTPPSSASTPSRMDSVTGPRPGQIRPPRRTGGAGGGTPGPQGPPGPTGPAGVGVPTGGTSGQVLEKASATDYDTVWANPPVTQGLSGTWNYKATGGTTDPGVGNVAPDVVGAPTMLRFSTTTKPGTDARNIFLTTAPGDVILAQQQTDSTKWGKFQVSAALVDHSTWFEVPVTTLATGSGGTPATNADVVVDFNRTGTAVGGFEILTDTVPPADAVGATGDFYINSTTDIMYGPKAPPGGGFGSAVRPFAASTPTNQGGAPYNIGDTFKFTAKGRITALRFWRDASAPTTHEVYLWRTTGAQVAHVTTTGEPATAAGWVEVPLPTPVAVAVNDQLVVSRDVPTGDHVWYVNGPPSASADPTISWVIANYIATLGLYPSTTQAIFCSTDVVFEPETTVMWPVALEGGGGAAQTLAYRHVQSSAATTWSITHNLSFRPNISAVDSTGREIWPGATDYTSATAVQLTFSAAVAGEAYLS